MRTSMPRRSSGESSTFPSRAAGSRDSAAAERSRASTRSAIRSAAAVTARSHAAAQLWRLSDWTAELASPSRAKSRAAAARSNSSVTSVRRMWSSGIPRGAAAAGSVRRPSSGPSSGMTGSVEDRGKYSLGIGEIGKHGVRAVRGKVLDRIPTGGDPDRARADAGATRDIRRGVTDDDHGVTRWCGPEPRGGPLGRDRGERRAVGGIAAVGPDGKAFGREPCRAELERGAALEITGEQAEQHVLPRLQPVEQVVNARHDGSLDVRPRELVLEKCDVALTESRHARCFMRRRMARGGQKLGDDLRIGLAVEPDAQE